MKTGPRMWISAISAAFLATAAADRTGTTPMPPAGAPVSPPAHGVMVMPLAGMPDSQVYVYPMAADPRAATQAAQEQLRAFAAMFHTNDPRIQQDFLEQWETVEKRRAVKASNDPEPFPAGTNNDKQQPVR